MCRAVLTFLLMLLSVSPLLGQVADDSRGPAVATLEDADVSAVVTIDLATAPATWTLKPDPAPPVKTVDKAVFPFEAPFFSLRGYALHVGPFPPGPAASPQLRRADLTTGKISPPCTIPRQAHVCDFSPDGNHVLATWRGSHTDSKRVELWKLGDNAAKRVVSFDVVLPPGRRPAVYRLGFINDDTAYVMDHTGELTVWKLTTAKAVWRAKLSPTFVHVSPGGKQLLAQSKDRLYVFDAATGKVLASTVIAPTELEVAPWPDWFRTNVSLDGRRFGMLGQDRFYFVDLTSGQYSGDYGWYNNAGIRRPLFVADRYVVLQDLLFDMKQQNYVYHYFNCIGEMVGGKFWYQTYDGKQYGLIPVTLPHDRAAGAVEGMKAEQAILLKPGMKVGIDVDLKTPEHAAAIQQRLQAAAVANGWTVDPKAPLRVVAKHYMGRKFGAVAAGQSPIDPTAFVARLSVEKDGKVLWQTRHVSREGFQADLFFHTRPPQRMIGVTEVPLVSLRPNGFSEGRPIPMLMPQD